ncbi:hypothetical protein BJ138DRAFT_657062 [Hygrophoropsis aurantiaca]|uniref:Uncharacterized protein n=1 Tax=Hygrophoropsis aurantiaca TaxID=72124 RepID=A0ACB8AJ66_9AGAM|nr:hypothetical protein BJ138DRAFT_657062 [Hygrophoropsis aurantiaca]
MTRITNFGRKRTYVEAGFSAEAAADSELARDVEPSQETTSTHRAADPTDSTSDPSKKKRKRTKKPKADGSKGKESTEIAEANAEQEGESSHSVQEKKTKKKPLKAHKKNYASDRIKRSEDRRLRRISERDANTICFACREKGHSARDCPKAGDGKGKKGGDKVVGICYRCGSTRHGLSRCKQPEDPLNPLPFASCFVCSGKGHLASSCPQNKERGIYPDGGSCKLCGDITHLAKNCGLRKENNAGTITTLLGTGKDTGADEDDFHTFKRRNAEVDKDEKRDEKTKRIVDIKAGVHTGIVKAFGKPSIVASKKVVHF